MAIGQPISSWVFLTVAVVTCVSLGACENATVPTRHLVSSEECGLAAKAFERMISGERPLTHPWHLDFDPPPTFWERDAFIHPAMLEQAGEQERYIWLEHVSEAPSPLPRFLRRREADPEAVRGPSVEMAQAFAAVTPINAASCPEVYAYAASQKALPTRGDSRRSPRRPNDLWFMVERAVISPDGKEAIVSFAMDSVGTLVLYRKQPDGRWQEAAMVHSWVS